MEIKKYKCVNCQKPNMADQLRCTNCGTLHDKNFQEQKYHVILKHLKCEEKLSEIDVNEEDLIKITGINLQDERLEKFIKEGRYTYGFLEYTWSII